MILTVDPEATVSVSTKAPDLLDVFSLAVRQEFVPMPPTSSRSRIPIGASAATPASYRGEGVQLDETRREAAAGFAAAFAWAMRQDFEPDHAERMRREAWGIRSE